MNSYVFISGATGGLGRSFVKAAARKGWNLFLSDIPGSPLQELAEETQEMYSVRVLFLAGSFLTSTERDTFFRKVNSLNIQFHFLINVAGLEFETPFTSLDLNQIRIIMNVNMNGTIELSHEILKLRDPEHGFKILTVSSLSYFYPMPYKALYSSTKRFLYHFFTSLREELRSENVSVTLLCPAGMPTKKVVVDRIEAQGLMGKITSREPDSVAEESIRRALRGDEEYIPGMVNRLLRAFSSILSDSARARAVKRRWDKALRMKG